MPGRGEEADGRKDGASFPSELGSIEEEARPFARAVVRQMRSGGRDEQESAAAVARLLEVARQGREVEAADALADDHPLLAAFFQNTDLLYDQGYAGADGVSMIVLHALHLAVEREPAEGVVRDAQE